MVFLCKTKVQNQINGERKIFTMNSLEIIGHSYAKTQQQNR